MTIASFDRLVRELYSESLLPMHLLERMLLLATVGTPTFGLLP